MGHNQCCGSGLFGSPGYRSGKKRPDPDPQKVPAVMVFFQYNVNGRVQFHYNYYQPGVRMGAQFVSITVIVGGRVVAIRLVVAIRVVSTGFLFETP